MGLRLDLGSGPKPSAGYTGVDLEPAEEVYGFDLASGQPWPFADGSVEELRSSHFIEHVPPEVVEARHFVELGGSRVVEPTSWVKRHCFRDALVWVMEEAWRVAKPGALFHLSWPSLYDEQTGAFQPWAFADPTHRRFIPKEFLHYLSAQDRARLGVAYDWRCNWVIAQGSGQQRNLGGDIREIAVDLRKEPLP